MIIDSTEGLDSIAFGAADGLIPVIAQHAVTGEVLMLAYANREAFEHTLREGVLWLYSRSRSELWRKGDTSGNIMRVVALHADCDRDSVVALVMPAGPACHTGDRSCFMAPPTLVALADTIVARAEDPATGGYTRKLLDNPNLRGKKLGEEAVELALACAAGDAGGAAEEFADLMYHALVACHATGAALTDVLGVLERRSGRTTADAVGADRAGAGTPAAE